MKVLFLVYSPQESLEKFSELTKTNFPWVDVMVKELSGSEEISIGLVVPLKQVNFQKTQKGNIVIYGVPDLVVSQRTVDFILKRRTSLQNPEILSYTIKAINDFNPDIIQIFGTENIFGLIQGKTKQPVVIHFQGSVMVVATKWFSGISKWEQIRALSIRKLFYRSGCFFEYFTFKDRGLREEIIMQSCKYFVGRTDFDRRLIKLLSPEANYFFCEEFIRNEFFSAKWEVPLTNTISCISTLKGVTYKGLDLILDTLDLLHRYTSLKVDFRICGVSENEEVVKILRRRDRKGKLMSHIQFLGKLDTSSLISELKSSNFFIHPSYIENSSNSICEAMALGMPVIATRVGGTDSLINDGINGILVQEGDPFSMAAAIQELANNYEKAVSIGHNARDKAIQRHQTQRLREEMISIYQRIIFHSRTS